MDETNTFNDLDLVLYQKTTKHAIKAANNNFLIPLIIICLLIGIILILALYI